MPTPIANVNVHVRYMYRETKEDTVLLPYSTTGRDALTRFAETLANKGRREGNQLGGEGRGKSEATEERRGKTSCIFCRTLRNFYESKRVKK